MAQGNRTPIFVGYKDENNVVYKTREATYLHAQALLGEVALAGGEPELPKSLIPRYTTVRDATHNKSVKLRVFSAGAPILTGGTAINVNETVAGALTLTPFTSSGEFQSERRPRANARP